MTLSYVDFFRYIKLQVGLLAFGLLVAPGTTLAAPTCTPTQEICGDGIDQDCTGADLLCPAPDQDRDGFTANDCNDTDRYMYPGISETCTAGCGAGTRTCQSNGTYSACSCAPLCEATGGGTCYYISPNGNDANPGTYAQPWRTYMNIVTYWSSGEHPAQYKYLQPGDVVYFLPGVYRPTYVFEEERALFLKSTHGTAANPITLKAYPGATKPVIWPVKKAIPIHFWDVSHIKVEGFELKGGWQAGIWLDESSNLEVRNLWIHDNDGPDNGNMSGLYVVRVQNLYAHHNRINDNYDHTNADTGGQVTENSRDVVLFDGGNIQLNYNVIYQTPPMTSSKTGGCVTYKHSNDVPNSTFEAAYNILWNCYEPSIGVSSFNSHIHHNFIKDSGAMGVKDYGGTAHLENIVIEKNTIVGGMALNYYPTTSYGPLGTTTFRNNVVYDTKSYNHTGGNPNVERGMIVADPYGSSSMYNASIGAGKLVANSNCYYNPNHTPQWSIFESISAGDVENFSGWKGRGFDTDSVQVDPQFDIYHRATNSACSGDGWNAP